MNDETLKTPEPETGAPAAATAEAAAAEAGASAPSLTAELEAALETARADAANLKDQVLRTLADMENLRRRTEREVRDSAQYAITGFARDLLSVSDNLARAVQSAGDSEDAAVKAVVEGVSLTERELAKVLEKHGVKRIAAEGEKFDPHLHQAMFEVPNPELPSGTVVQELQSGYVIGERVLRPALVGVAKGGPKAKAEG
ncbi:nucleotide exchange factor GrpE [Segnochrobactraceae bacterium EtOH-i3]